MTRTRDQDDERRLRRDARVAAMECVLGSSGTAPDCRVNPSESNPQVEIIFFRNHLDGVVVATSGLIGCDNQILNDQGNYELVICCREDDEWGPLAIRSVADYTLRSALNPGETMNIDWMTPDGSSIVAFLFCDFGRFEVRDREAGLLLCLGITAGELSQCRNGKRRQVESTLKDAGVYPFTDLSRETTASSVLIPETLPSGLHSVGSLGGSTASIGTGDASRLVPPYPAHWSMGRDEEKRANLTYSLSSNVFVQ